MNPAKLYLSILQANCDWTHIVFRDVATLRDIWEREHVGKPWHIAIVHLGYERPDYNHDQLQEVLTPYSEITQPVLLTEAAKWAMPSRFAKTTTGMIGSCTFSSRQDACGLYLSTEEWGYTTSRQCNTAIVDQKPVYTISDATGWIADLVSHDEDAGIALLAAGISTEEEFRVRREHLTPSLLEKAENCRFMFMLAFCDKSDPFELLNIAPEWLLACHLDQIDLSVRVANVFRREEVQTVGDIRRFKLTDLLRMQNFGRKSIETLAGSLLSAFHEYKDNTGILLSDFGTKAEHFTDYDIAKTPLHEHFVRTLGDLPDNAKRILLGRFGFDGNTPLTLQQLGEVFGITRERIRQIEKKYLERLIERELWDNFMVHRLQVLLKDRQTPLFIEFLGVEDHWFDGFAAKLECLEEIITRFSEEKITVIAFEGRRVVSEVSQKVFDRLILELNEWIAERKDQSPTKSEIEDHIRTALIGFNIEYLYEFLWASFSENLHFSNTGGIERLSGIGRSAENLVRIVLNESELPLHYSDIHRRVLEISERQIDIRRVQSSLVGSDYFLLFNRGTYGVEKHLRFSQEDIQHLLSKAEEVVRSGSSHKQWHSSEILDEMSEEFGELPSGITSYELSIVLGNSENLISLGKHVWVSKYDEGLSSSDRIQVMDAFIKILEQAGGPLSTQELKERVMSYRGITSHMQINPNDVMIRVSPDHWGLIHRDIPLSLDGLKSALETLFVALEDKQKSLHISELPAVFAQHGFAYPEALHPYSFLSLCGTDERFKVWQGRLIGLSVWQEPRRQTILGAVREVYSSLDLPFKLEDVHLQVQQVLDRPIERSKVSGHLSNIGAVYNREKDIWSRPEIAEAAEQDNIPQQLIQPQVHREDELSKVSSAF